VKAGDRLFTIREGDVETVEAGLSSPSPIIKKKIKNFVSPPASIFLPIIRSNEVIIPHGETEFQPEDTLFPLVKFGSMGDICCQEDLHPFDGAKPRLSRRGGKRRSG
jgi:Trk K+ transport system NAD-binding subunit